MTEIDLRLVRGDGYTSLEAPDDANNILYRMQLSANGGLVYLYKNLGDGWQNTGQVALKSDLDTYKQCPIKLDGNTNSYTIKTDASIPLYGVALLIIRDSAASNELALISYNGTRNAFDTALVWSSRTNSLINVEHNITAESINITISTKDTKVFSCTIITGNPYLGRFGGKWLIEQQ